MGKSPKPVRKIIKMLEMRTKRSMTLTEVWQDDKFLNVLFENFMPIERTVLAQVSIQQTLRFIQMVTKFV